jgi:hypothetical protein
VTTRLSVLFNGSPDEEGAQTLHDIVGRDYQRLPFSRFAKWRNASKNAGIWSLDLDVVPLNRPKIIFVLVTETSTDEDVELCCRELVEVNSLPLRLFGEENINPSQRVSMKEHCVDICDRVMVVNSDEMCDDESKEIIELALTSGKRVAYLKY